MIGDARAIAAGRGLAAPQQRGAAPAAATMLAGTVTSKRCRRRSRRGERQQRCGEASCLRGIAACPSADSSPAPGVASTPARAEIRTARASDPYCSVGRCVAAQATVPPATPHRTGHRPCRRGHAGRDHRPPRCRLWPSWRACSSSPRPGARRRGSRSMPRSVARTSAPASCWTSAAPGRPRSLRDRRPRRLLRGASISRPHPRDGLPHRQGGRWTSGLSGAGRQRVVRDHGGMGAYAGAAARSPDWRCRVQTPR